MHLWQVAEQLCGKNIQKWYLKHLLSFGKSMVLCWQLCVASLQHFNIMRGADVTQSTSLPTWHQSILWHGRLHTLQICLKSLLAAQINWSLERNGTVNISALTENSFKALPNRTLWLYRRSCYLQNPSSGVGTVSCSTPSLSLCVYWPFEMPLFQFQRKLPLHLNLSCISSPLKKEIMKCIFWIKPLSFLRERD